MNDEKLPPSEPQPKLEITFDDKPEAAGGPPPAPPLPAVGPPLQGNSAMAVAAMSVNRKSVGVAVLLSIIVTGAGQIYCGRAGRGIAFFAAAFCSVILMFVLIGFILFPIVWIWAAIDAANLANQHNAALVAAVVGQDQQQVY